MVKTLNKVDTEGTYLNITKTLYENPTVNKMNDEKLNAFPLRPLTSQECPSHIFY